ncbi:MAG: 50S ribosomal protein L11 methyltransferase [Saprospiraceae bacterium]
MNNNYYCISTHNDAKSNDVIIALLGQLPFDTFEENENGINAYIKVADFSAAVAEELKQLAVDMNFSFEKELIESQNWNEVWESNFHPIMIDDFCAIRADFHAPIENMQFEIVIHPKMAFGTGHHETTHMVIQQMRDIDFKDKSVFDYGCGTGILAILAAKLGATRVVGVDNEFPAFESTEENAKINATPHIEAIFGTLKDVKAEGFDVILANINRNIIVSSLAVLHQKLNPGGLLLMSGFLKADESHMKNELTRHGFSHVNTMQRGEWISILAKYN